VALGGADDEQLLLRVHRVGALRQLDRGHGAPRLAHVPVPHRLVPRARRHHRRAHVHHPHRRYRAVVLANLRALARLQVVHPDGVVAPPRHHLAAVREPPRRQNRRLVLVQRPPPASRPSRSARRSAPSCPTTPQTETPPAARNDRSDTLSSGGLFSTRSLLTLISLFAVVPLLPNDILLLGPRCPSSVLSSLLPRFVLSFPS
jgi:hypothetical protein